MTELDLEEAAELECVEYSNAQAMLEHHSEELQKALRAMRTLLDKRAESAEREEAIALARTAGQLEQLDNVLAAFNHDLEWMTF